MHLLISYLVPYHQLLTRNPASILISEILVYPLAPQLDLVTELIIQGFLYLFWNHLLSLWSQENRDRPSLSDCESTFQGYYRSNLLVSFILQRFVQCANLEVFFPHQEVVRFGVGLGASMLGYKLYQMAMLMFYNQGMHIGYIAGILPYTTVLISLILNPVPILPQLMIPGVTLISSIYILKIDRETTTVDDIENPTFHSMPPAELVKLEKIIGTSFITWPIWNVGTLTKTRRDLAIRPGAAPIATGSANYFDGIFDILDTFGFGKLSVAMYLSKVHSAVVNLGETTKMKPINEPCKPRKLYGLFKSFTEDVKYSDFDSTIITLLRFYKPLTQLQYYSSMMSYSYVLDYACRGDNVDYALMGLFFYLAFAKSVPGDCYTFALCRRG